MAENPFEYLQRVLTTYGRKAAIREGSNDKSYYDLFEEVEQIASWLDSLEGATLAVVVDDSATLCRIVLAAFFSQKVILPLNSRESDSYLVSHIDRLRLATVITDKAGRFDHKQGAKEVVFQYEAIRTAEQRDVTAHETRGADPERPALGIMTSGSTGTPKVVLHSWRSIFYSALGSILYYGYSDSDASLLTLPLYHVSGVLMLVRCILSGGTLHIMQGKLGESVERARPTILSLVPTQLVALLQDKSAREVLAKGKVILIGGASVPETLWETCRTSDLPLSLSYGMTESAAQVTGTVPGTWNSYRHYGKPLPYREVRVSEGRILVGGLCLFSGLLDRPSDLCDGWFMTQDRGCFEDGNLVVLGRADNVFISGGENISPWEVESAVERALGPAASVLCFPEADPYWGVTPSVIVVSRDEPDWTKLRTRLGESLSGLKKPKKYYWLDEWSEKLTPQASKGAKVFLG
ncbi:MAG: AMP-binding protein [Oligoflexales bacterium]